MRREKINNTPVYPASAIAKNNYEWSAEDDLLLIANVESTSDFSALERCVTFSQRFTAFQIRSRWQALLEDPNTVKISERAVRRLSRDEVITKQLYNRLQVLPSREELATISKIPSTIQIYNKSDKHKQNNLYRSGAASNNSLSSSFLQHFEKNHRKFHTWSQLRWYNLLKNQKVDILTQHKKQESKTISKLIDGSSSENEDDNSDSKNPDHLHRMSAIENGHILQNQSLIRQARKLLNDPQYDTIQSSSSRLNRKTVENMNRLKQSINVQTLPTHVMGVLEGRFLNYNIKSSNLSCGFFNIQETKENQLNLSLELDLLETPEIYFEITHEYDKNSSKKMLPRFFLRNVTLPDADFSVLVTTSNDVYCLLDGETVELENYSMITVLNLNFILHINPMFKPSPKSIKFGTQGVKMEDHASSVESGKVRISPPYMDDPCVISGQIYPPTSAMQPLTVGQIVDIRGYNIQTSSLDGSQSTQPIVETGVTMSPDEEFDNSDDENIHFENFARQQIRPQPRIEIITPVSIPSPGYIPSPHPSSRSFGNNNSAQKSDKNSSTDLNSTVNSTETDKDVKDADVKMVVKEDVKEENVKEENTTQSNKYKLDFDKPEKLELPFSPTANPHDDSGDLIIDFSE